MNPIDKYNLYAILEGSINQLSASLEFFHQNSSSHRPFNKIILCGMGGSALVGDLFVFFKSKKYSPLTVDLPIVIHRSYGLPLEADHNSLVICISYSGNTEEAISSYLQAQENGLETAGIASGGKLAELFDQNHTPWVKIPRTDIPPRLSLGYQLSALTNLFVVYGFLNQAARSELAALPARIKMEGLEEQAQTICDRLINKVPIIYSSRDNGAIARIWKIKFNETSKTPSFYNEFPELNHNEMVGWTKNIKPFFFLFINDDDDDNRIQRRMQLTADIIKELGSDTENIKITGSDPLEKIFRAIALGDWLTYYLAIAYETDPTPVELVEKFKKRLDAI